MYQMANPARGVQKHGEGTMRRIVVAFPPDTFEEIRQHALRERTSFAEQVRKFVEWGLEIEETRDDA